MRTGHPERKQRRAGHARRARGLALLAALCVPLAARAEPDGRVLVLLGGESEPYRAAGQACLEALAAEGIRAEIQVMTDADSQTPYPARDLYVAVGQHAAKALALELPPSAPLVHCMISQPEAGALPQRTCSTGVTTTVPARDQFRLIERAAPGAKRIGVLHRAGSPTSAALLGEARAQLPRGWTIQAVDMDEYKSAAEAIDALFADRPDAIWTIPDPAVYDGAVVKALLIHALRADKPVFAFSSQLVRAGTLAGVSIDPAEQGRQAAEIARQALASPGTIPPAQPPRYHTAVNLIVAEKLNLDLPPALVSEADQVYR